MVNTFIVLKPDIVSRLLNHFLRASPRWLSTRTGSERTNYLEWLFPAIADSPLVLNCILTIASADLLKYERGDLELQHVAVEYYGQSVSSLRTAIETEMTETVTPDAPLSGMAMMIDDFGDMALINTRRLQSARSTVALPSRGRPLRMQTRLGFTTQTDWNHRLKISPKRREYFRISMLQ